MDEERGPRIDLTTLLVHRIARPDLWLCRPSVPGKHVGHAADNPTALGREDAQLEAREVAKAGRYRRRGSRKNALVHIHSNPLAAVRRPAKGLALKENKMRAASCCLSESGNNALRPLDWAPVR